MMRFLARLFPGAAARIEDAYPRDAAAMARLHAASFRRGWSEEEFSQLLADRAVLAHKAVRSGVLTGFILSRVAAGEAEILSVAVARRAQGRGIAGQLLAAHLGRVAGMGADALFLEVDEGNEPARRLYARAGFREVGRRAGYYQDALGRHSTALVLRRDLS